MVEFDNPIVYGVAAFIYIIFMVVIWRVPSWGSIDIKTRILLTIVAYPIFYLVADGMANK